MVDLPAVAGRAAAAASGWLVAGGAVAITAAVVAGPGAGVAGYVSEAGTGGYPLAATYRAGVLAVAAGLALLGAVTAPFSALAGGLLGVAALAAALSGAVPCSAGCPLPPFEAATGADLLHGGASIVGVASCAFAMVALAATGRLGPGVRRLAALAAGLTVPLGGAVGLAMLFAGRGSLTGALERVLLVTAAAWLVATATLFVRGAAAGAASSRLESARATASTWRNDR